MKKKVSLVLTLITVFAISAIAGTSGLFAAKPASAAETVTTEKFDMSEVTVNTTASYGNSISKRTVSVADADYSPANGPALYGYRLQTVNEYSRSVKSGNTSSNATYSSDGTAITIDTYSVPHNHAITASINQTINTDEDVDFYMAPFVNGSQYSNITASSKFYMILADTDVEVKYNGVTTSGNYLSLVFNRYTVNWSRNYDAGDAGYPVEYSEKGRQSGDAQSGQVGSQNAWLKAFYGVPFNDGTYEKTIGLVKTNYHFYNDGNDDYVVITCSGVYKENISQAISDRSFVYTAKLSDFGLTASSNMKLYFGYAHENAGWANSSEGYGFTGDENCQGTPGSDAEVRLIPMGLELYNYTNGIKDVYAVNGGIKVTAGETYDLSDNVALMRFAGDDGEEKPTVSFVSDNEDFVVDGSTLTVAQSANGIATITATADGKSCTFKAYTYNDDDYAVKATWNGSVGTMGANGGKGSLAFYADNDSDKGLYGYRLEGTANYYGFDSAITYAYDVDYAKGESIIIDTVQDQNTGNSAAGNVYKGLRITLRGTDRWEGNGTQISPFVSLALMPQWTNSYKNNNILRYELRGYGEGATAQVNTCNNASISAALSSAAYYLKVEITSDTTNNTTTFRLVALDKGTFAEVGEKLELTIGIGHTGAGRYNYGKNVKLSVSQFTNRNAMAIDDSSLQDRDKTIAVDLGVYNFRNGGFADLTCRDVALKGGDNIALSDAFAITYFDGDIEEAEVSFVSSDEEIAYVSGDRIYVTDGTTAKAEITATVGETQKKFTVNRFMVTANYGGSAGTLGEGGEEGSVSVAPVADDEKGIYGYKATGTAYYYGWKTRFDYDYAIDVTKPVSFLLEPNYESSGPGDAVYNESTKCRKVHIEMAGAGGGAVSWNIFAPWAGSTPNRIYIYGNGTGGKVADTSKQATATNYVNAFYAANNSEYFLKVEIVPNGAASKLVLSAVNKTTLEEDETKYEITFNMPVLSGEVTLSTAYYSGNQDVAIEDVPDRERVTNVNFGVYNFRNGAAFSAEFNDATKKVDSGDEIVLDDLVDYTVNFDTKDFNVDFLSTNETFAKIEDGKVKIVGSEGSSEIILSTSEKISRILLYAESPLATEAKFSGSANAVNELNFGVEAGEIRGLYGYRLSGTAGYYGFTCAIEYDGLDYGAGISFILDPNFDNQTGISGELDGKAEANKKAEISISDGEHTYSLKLMPRFKGSTNQFNVSGTGINAYYDINYNLRTIGGSDSGNIGGAFFGTNGYVIKVVIADLGNGRSSCTFIPLLKSTLERGGEEWSYEFDTPAFDGEVSLKIKNYTDCSDIISEEIEEYERTIEMNFGVFNFANGTVKRAIAQDIAAEPNSAYEAEIKYVLFDGAALSDSDLSLISSKTSVASVSDNEVSVKDVSVGYSVISVMDGIRKVGEFTVYLPVDEVSVSNKDELATVYGTGKVEVSGDVASWVEYTSSDESVLEVSENGVITVKANGTAVVTAAYLGKTDSVTINAVNSVEIAESETELKVGETYRISVIPDYAPVTYSSSDSSVVTVSGSGLVTAVGAGTAEVTVSLGEFSVTLSVSVSVEYTLDSDRVTVEVGKSVRVPLSTSDYSAFTYVSADESVFTVSDDGKITGVKEGTAYLVVNVAKDKTETIRVSVKPKTEEPVSEPESVSESKTEQPKAAAGCMADTSSGFGVAAAISLLLAAVAILKKKEN